MNPNPEPGLILQPAYGCIECFRSTSKKDEIHQTTYHDFDESRRALFRYIKGWYNRSRIYSGLDYLTPQETEEKLLKSALSQHAARAPLDMEEGTLSVITPGEGVFTLSPFAKKHRPQRLHVKRFRVQQNTTSPTSTKLFCVQNIDLHPERLCDINCGKIMYSQPYDFGASINEIKNYKNIN
ncbi:MAG: IS3 family transposase [Sporolactobacillus sp.]